MTDIINEPDHYKAGGLEAIDVLEAFFPDDPLGWQVGKYILRYKKKNGLEDLQKAEVYLKRLIAKLTPEPPVETPREPRVWDSLLYVPFTVRVVDEDRDIWSYRQPEGWGYARRQGNWMRARYDLTNYCGPFTEMLDG
ncbi:nucleotide kinase [Mycobacterium phage Astro]|uniref:DUF3310 domain-containing protein n=1 Tax=Mycobacterium phage Astro TaxID=2902840 RepID=I6R1N0_9CAUD|nr:nucleotide kinase [Mycobacterium phage Astro]AFM54946.1 hypothetical protein ASTRO_55 [Mycobacterium phage Astro]